MTGEQITSGVGIFTLTLTWDDKKGDVQWVRGGIWGETKVQINERVIGALEVALQNVRRELMSAVVEETIAQTKASEAKE
jgi:hypothetical protein